MERNEIIRLATDFTNISPHNFVPEAKALLPEMSGMRIFEPPILAFGDAADDCFESLKEPFAVGEHFMIPEQWLNNAKTVISFFLPFTEQIRKGNKKDMSWPSAEWLHGRIEGQEFVVKLTIYLLNNLVEAGFDSVAPILDPRFSVKKYIEGSTLRFASSWSERHVAYVCGLGTFGLSKGLITKKGICGRFGSIITAIPLPTDKRKYTGINDYCSMCGVCAHNCPVEAITLEQGKNDKICSEFIDGITKKCRPYYGCGKCQVGVPCEVSVPK